MPCSGSLVWVYRFMPNAWQNQRVVTICIGVVWPLLPGICKVRVFCVPVTPGHSLWIPAGAELAFSETLVTLVFGPRPCGRLVPPLEGELLVPPALPAFGFWCSLNCR